MRELEHGTIFEKGIPNPFGQYFTGTSYLAMLTQLEGVGVANVTFEPACRNNWHVLCPFLHRGRQGGNGMKKGLPYIGFPAAFNAINLIQSAEPAR